MIFGWCRMWWWCRCTFCTSSLFGGASFWDRTLFPSVCYQFYYYLLLSVVLLFRFRFRCHPIAFHRRRCHLVTVVEDWIWAINSFDGVYIHVAFSVWIVGGFVGAPCRITVSWRYFQIAAALRSMSPYLPINQQLRESHYPFHLFRPYLFSRTQLVTTRRALTLIARDVLLQVWSGSGELYLAMLIG